MKNQVFKLFYICFLFNIIFNFKNVVKTTPSSQPSFSNVFCNTSLLCGLNALCINNNCICQFGYNTTAHFSNCTQIYCQYNSQCPIDGQCVNEICQCPNDSCTIDYETQLCHKKKSDTLNLLVVLPIIIIPLGIIVCFAFRLHIQLLKTGHFPERVGWRQFINWPFDWPDKTTDKTKQPQQKSFK